MQLLVDTLFTISNGLLIPVMLLLLSFCAWSLLEIGVFAREAFDRWSSRKIWTRYAQQLATSSCPEQRRRAEDFFGLRPLAGILAEFSLRGISLRDSRPQLEHLASTLEIQSMKQLSTLNVGVRIAPMLGLMGTLIPLGPALIGLSHGDLESLAQNLVVAFSTTVVGLFVGGICYVLGHWRRHWYAQDLAAIDLVLTSLYGQMNSTEKGADHELACST